MYRNAFILSIIEVATFQVNNNLYKISNIISTEPFNIFASFMASKNYETRNHQMVFHRIINHRFYANEIIDYVIELFQTSVEKYNLIYQTMITDGDISVHQAIVDHNVYGKYNVSVKIVNCVNHFLRRLS